MSLRSAVLLMCLAALASCRRAPEPKQYELSGQILAMAPQRREVTIKHGDIKNFMPGMTMPFTVKDGGLLADKQPGDLVTATLVVGEVEAYLSTLTKTGHAALDAAAVPAAQPDVLRPGDEVRDARLIDQDGRERTLSSLRGRRVALTFIYTRCPLPDYCPLMNRNFAAVQREIASRPALKDVVLLTATMDPEFDTPKVLKPLAEAMNADPAIWSFVTGEPAEVARFASQFGIYVERDPQDAAQLIHNLRTAILDTSGRLVKIETGNSWTAATLVADLEAPATASH